MATEISAQQIIDRIKDQCAATWKTSASDVFNTGSPDTRITGIVTSFTPSIRVLQQSVATGNNLIITQQPAYYGETDDYLKNDPAYLYKKDIIGRHQLVIWRFYDNWNALKTDGHANGQLRGLAKALGWDKYGAGMNDPAYAAGNPAYAAGNPAYATKTNYFLLPEGLLRDKVTEIEERLKIQGIRIIGDPATRIRKAALFHGMFQFTELQETLKDPDIDLLVLAEAIEWESPEYFRDLLTWKGKNKAMVLIGREASEDPGYGEVASWLSGFVPEVPVTWISAEEPFWIP